MTRVGAISFDLWDTVFVDDSDEPKRKAQGLPAKKVERRDLVEGALARHAPIPRQLIDVAYDTADAAFGRVWHEQHVTWTVAERLDVVLSGLGRQLPPAELDELVRQHEQMELRVSPDLACGVAEAISALRGVYRLLVVSDAIFSPGWALRELLERHGLLDAFAGFVFSDELGWSKPAPAVFHRAAELAGCDLEALVHVGDREHNDIAGPKALGARAVLATAVKDRGSEKTRADAVCADYGDLPAIIAGLDSS